jgi:hypothetical protein
LHDGDGLNRIHCGAHCSATSLHAGVE